MAPLSRNIPSTIFSGSIFSELLVIARYSLRADDFIPRESDLFLKMIVQGGHRSALKQTFHRYPNVFQKSDITDGEINLSIKKNI